MLFPAASNLLRGAYVEVAESEFPVSGKPQTDSRITLLTGVHRKDVKRLRGRTRGVAPAPRAASLGAQVIGRWLAEPDYREADGAPRPLPRLAAGGDDGPSFESLVRSVNTDIRPRVVLDEWLRLGLVRVDERDRVCLDVQAFIPAEGSEEMAYFFGRNVHDHLAAAVHNMLGEEPSLLERSVNYTRLTPAAAAELRELGRRRGVALLQEMNARALELQRRDAGLPDATQRVNLGIFLYVEDQPPTEDDPDDAPS